MKSSRVLSFRAGVLVANSAPHLATAVTGRRHLTPLAGKDSGPLVNGIWSGLNLAGGVALLARASRDHGPRWNRDLVAFELGCVTFAGWMVASEGLWPVNSDRH